MGSVLRSRVASVLGSQVIGAKPSEGGYSGSRRWILSLENGLSVFIKVGTTDHTRHRLRDEARFYQSFQSEFTPELVGFDDDLELPFLLLEDLSDATWPPPWTADEIERVLGTLEHVASSSPPDYLPSLEQYRAGLSGWERVEEDPSSFLSLGMTTEDWLGTALPVMRHASEQAVLSGSSLVHFDVRSDNVAFTPDRTVLVDWSIPAIGNPLADIVGWLPSLHVEGGPPPHEVLGNEGKALVALVTGYWASQAGLPPPQGAPQVRGVQRAQLEVSLPWAARLLDLPPP